MSLPASTLSTQTFHTIQNWMNECLTAHSKCTKPSSPQPEMDKHLIGIRFLQIRKPSVFLVEDVRPIRCAALSHCWGSGDSILRTTVLNITRRRKGILQSELPQSFHEAVQICQRLDIEYLWIDSLCIIQDDVRDWNAEAFRMADVYGNAYVMIAASKAKNPL